MITLTDILKKASNFGIIGVAACMVLLSTENVVAGECTVSSSSTAGIASPQTYKNRDANGCFDSIPMDITANTNISSLPGLRNGSEHKGLDVGTRGGYDTIYAPADGTISSKNFHCSGNRANQGAGKAIEMRHQLNPNNVNYSESGERCTHYYTKFFHLSAAADGVTIGATYKRGAAIAIAGGTKCVNGQMCEDRNVKGSCGYDIHMHYEVRMCQSFGTTVNPLCMHNQSLCDGTEGVKQSAESTFNNSVESLDDCSKIPSPAIVEYNECLKRNEAKQKKNTTAVGGSAISTDYWSKGPIWNGTSAYSTPSGSAKSTKVETNYKCNIAENYNSIKGCLFCDLFKIIFDTASSVARTCHEKFAGGMIPLLGVGLAIWLAWLVMRYVSDMTVKDPAMMLNEILGKVFVVVFIIVLLKLNVTEFFDMFITPIFVTGFKLANLIMDTSSCGNFGVDGSGLPAEMGNSMLCAISAVQERLEKLMALGSNAICIAFHVKSFMGIVIFPHFGYLLTGVFLWLIAIVFMVVYPFLLIDSVLQFTVASSLFPVALAATAFNVTKKYLNIFKVANIFMCAMFTFIFLTVVLFILLNGIDNSVMKTINMAFDKSSGGDFFSLEALGWHTKTFMELVFFLFLGKAVLEDIPNFAENFAKAISLGEKGGKSDLGIGRKVGGMAAGLATNVGKEAVSKTWDTTKSAGRLAINTARNTARSARYNYLMSRTKDKIAEQRMAGGSGNTVTGRDWLGRKVTRTIVTNPDGTVALESSRKGMFRKDRTVTTRQNSLMSIQTKTYADGSKKESYNIKSSFAKSLINKDGTRNDVAVNALLQGSGLNKEEINKVILNQMLKQRMPNAKGVDLEGKFKNEQIISSVDAQGREVFEVRRTMADGSVKVFRMTKGKERDLIEFEQIGKDGSAKKMASDGIIQMSDSYDYDINKDGTLNTKPKVMINGADLGDTTVIVSADGKLRDGEGRTLGTVQANGNLVDEHGNVVGTANVPELVFDQNGNVMGKMTVDGRIVDDKGKEKGLIRDDGSIVDNNLNIVGAVAPEKRAEMFANATIKGGKHNMKFSNAQSFKGVQIFDEDGNLEDSMSEAEIMFDEYHLQFYKYQMKKYGDVLQQHSFGR